MGGAERRAAEEKLCEYTLDGSVDIKGRPAVKGKSGGWLAGGLILGNFILFFQPIETARISPY
jgi:hypothetical protein